MLIYHLATATDWEAALVSGAYTTSTRGRTLAQEGFIHASRADQWMAVRERWYAGVTEPLLLLVIDTDQLTSPVVEEAVAGAPAGSETFPHVYGPINPDAVLRATPVDRAAADLERSFTSLFVGEMARRVAVALAVMLVAVLGAVVGAGVDPDVGGAAGLLVGLAVGALLAWALVRRLSRLSRRARRPPRRSPS